MSPEKKNSLFTNNKQRHRKPDTNCMRLMNESNLLTKENNIIQI